MRAGIRTHIHLLPEVYTTTINVSSYYYFIPRHSLGVLEAQSDSQRDTHIHPVVAYSETDGTEVDSSIL